jgi:hypothetical protein
MKGKACDPLPSVFTYPSRWEEGPACDELGSTELAEVSRVGVRAE